MTFGCWQYNFLPCLTEIFIAPYLFDTDKDTDKDMNKDTDKDKDKNKVKDKDTTLL